MKERDPLLFYIWAASASTAVCMFVVFALLLTTWAWPYALVPYFMSACLALIAKSGYALWTQDIDAIAVTMQFIFNGGSRPA